MLVCFYCFSSVQAAVPEETSEILPPETVLLVEIKDFGQLKAQFEKTSFYELYKEPAMAAFVEDIKVRLNEGIEKLDDNNIYKAFYKGSILPEGRLAVALIVNEQTKNNKEAPILCISDWGGNIEKVKATMKGLVEKNTEMGGHFKGSEEYRAVSIDTLIDEDSVEFCYCFIDDCLIASFAGADVIKFVVAQMKGADSPTLADDSDYVSSLAATGPYRDIGLFLNIKKIVDMETADDDTGQAKDVVKNLGFDNVKTLCCSFGVARLGGDFSCGKFFLKIDGDKRGICRMLELESAPVRVPQFISFLSYSALFVNLDIKVAYDELVKIVSSFSPQTAAVFYMPLLPASDDGQPGIELKRDILEHLGSQIVFTQDIDRPITEKTGEPKWLFAVATTNPRALEKSLSTLHSKLIAPNKPDARRELLGHIIYIVDLPSLFRLGPSVSGKVPMQEASIQPASRAPVFAFTVTETHLVFGTADATEQAIRTLDSSSAESMVSANWFNVAKSAVPSVVGLAALEDGVTSAEMLWRELKKMAEGKSKSGGGRSEVSIGLEMDLGLFPRSFVKQSELVDFGLLPQFDVVRKYFGLSAFYGVSRPDGFFFEAKEIAAPRE
ncbi:hypothetical protein ES703_49696 [subsurface metagenome]